MKILSYGQTDIGQKRKINQDSFLKDDDLHLYVVADGMGGHLGGEVASQLAVQVMQKFCRENTSISPRDRLDQGVNAACRAIFEQAKTDPELSGMGTTIVAVLIEGDSATIAQVGDSRVYLLHGPGIWQVTEDHSLLNEEIRAGRLLAGQVANYQFKNVITRSVGYEIKVLVDVYHRQLSSGDRFLLCTDGLSGLVTMAEIQDLLLKEGSSQGLRALVDLANDRGGDDNITGVVVDVT